MDYEFLTVIFIVALACLFFLRRILAVLRKGNSPQCSCDCGKSCKNCSPARLD